MKSHPFLRSAGPVLALAHALLLWAQAAYANAPVVTSIIKPRKIQSSVSGGTREYFVDFGPAHFGSLSFRLSNSGGAQTGQVVIAEAASSTAIVTSAVGARSSTASISIAAGGKDYAFFENQPIRACRIRIPDPSVTLDTSSLAVNARHVPFQDAASSFTSSDTMLNRVFQFCKHSVKATSFLGVYIDGIRELKPYEGDAYINMLSHFALDSNPPVALFSHEYLLKNPTWPWEYRLQSILLGWEIYMATGDIDQLQRHYATLTGRIQLGIGSGSWNDSTALVDWPTDMRDGFVFTRGNVVTAAWIYKALMTIADVADALSRPSEAAAYRSRAAQTKKRINDSLFVRGQGLYKDGMATTHVSLHGNLYPLALGVVPDSLQGAVARYLASRGMACNVYAAQFLLDGLFDAGHDSAAIALMSARTGNSWGHMMDAVGSTITMEVWDPSQKPNLDWNHAWGTAPANVIPRKLFGIMPLSPGYGRFQIKPQVGLLASGRYALPTVKGTIAVAFESRRGQSMAITADVPASTLAKVYVPAFGRTGDDVVVDGRAVTGTRSGRFIAVDSIPPGRHVIERSSTPSASRRTAPADPGIRVLTGHGSVRLAGPVPATSNLTIRDCRGRIVGAMPGAAAGSAFPLEPGVYLLEIRSPGRPPVSIRFAAP